MVTAFGSGSADGPDAAGVADDGRRPNGPGTAGFAADVQRLVCRVPHGRVVSYGGVAALLGRPRAARAVGRVMQSLPDGSDVPWWRVINGRGEISIRGVLHGRQLQRALLEGEGVAFDARGRIDWDRFGWDGSSMGDRG
jgi:methylated-DNA-protein-cysteine methyltransferase related protein